MPAWLFYSLLSALFAALTAIFAKVGVKGVNPDLAAAIRTLVVLVLAWGIALARGAGAGLPDLTGRNWVFLLLSGLATGASWLCYFRALQVGQVSQVAPVDKLSLALTVILAVALLGEPLSLKAVGGVALIVSGVLLLIGA